MANVKNENGVQGFPYLKPPETTTWEKLTTTLYNKSENTVLGRTPFNWLKLLVFYSLFYTGLAALFAICMQVLFVTINDRSPKWTMDSGLIGSNPGMGFRPISDETDEGSLIWYDAANESSAQRWVNFLDDFLKDYNNINHPNRLPCDFNTTISSDKACEVDLEEFGDCVSSKSYGYLTSSPCVFLKLNRIYDWQPEYYNDPDNLPEDMSEELQQYIKDEYAIDPARANQIWISCSGENAVDKEHVSQFEYLPTRGFAGYYYPYTNPEGYLSPLVAVKIKNFEPNVIVSIECRAWAKNINYVGGYRDREGSVHFEIMRDVPASRRTAVNVPMPTEKNETSSQS